MRATVASNSATRASREDARLRLRATPVRYHARRSTGVLLRHRGAGATFGGKASFRYRVRHVSVSLDPDGDGSGGGLHDEDWFSFVALAGELYTLETVNLLSAADTEIDISRAPWRLPPLVAL